MSALSDHINNHIDIVSLISRYVSLKKSGTNYSGLCPFHSEKSPSFLVSPTKQIYKCFGCGKGWNAINFFMEIERVDYPDAIKQLAEDNRIDLTDFEKKRQASPEYTSDKEKLKRIMKLAQEFFVEQLHKLSIINNSKSSPWASSWATARESEGHVIARNEAIHHTKDLDSSFHSEWQANQKTNAYDYLIQKRWLSDTLITQLGLWYAPSQTQLFFTYFQKHGFSVEDLIESWLAKQNTNDIYPFFRDRLTIPIRDQLGNVIAFGARALQKDQEPKYLNSSESIIYDKSSTLYGIDHLKQWVKEHKSIIIVEGYFDVIALQQANRENAVATCGTSLTQQHISTLKRYSDTIYFLFDNDSAGSSATLRGLAIAYAQGVYPKVINLTPTPLPLTGSILSEMGSHELEGADRDSDGHPSLKGEGTRMRYKDIDEFVRNSTQADEDIQHLVNHATDGFSRAIHHYQNNYDTNSPIERQKSLNGLFDLIHAVSSLSTQNLFIEQLAHSFRIDYTLLISQYKQYIKNEKKVFWPRLSSTTTSTAQTTAQRSDQKWLLLEALLADDFWSTLHIDATWITSLKEFKHYILPGSHNEIQSWLQERQLWREKETETIIDKPWATTSFVKQVLWPYLLELQKTALKQADYEQRHIIGDLGKKIR